jgi:GNAT superfamily N-acetyltransferase
VVRVVQPLDDGRLFWNAHLRPHNAIGEPDVVVALVDGAAATVAADAVFQGLRTFNRANAVDPERMPLVLSAAGADGAIVGGLVGDTAWRWLFVNLLWVDEAHRGGGIGRRLLRAAEAEARSRNCTGAYLDTFDFHARPFYEGEGYTLFGTLEGYPPGHQRFYMQKRLVDG